MHDELTSRLLLLSDIDLANADVGVFEAYETEVLALLSQYGATLKVRVRSKDGKREIHILDFPNKESLEAFRGDPIRQRLRPKWTASGATSSSTEVMYVD